MINNYRIFCAVGILISPIIIGSLYYIVSQSRIKTICAKRRLMCEIQQRKISIKPCAVSLNVKQMNHFETVFYLNLLKVNSLIKIDETK